MPLTLRASRKKFALLTAITFAGKACCSRGGWLMPACRW
jgi:hypothetical protein